MHAKISPAKASETTTSTKVKPPLDDPAPPARWALLRTTTNRTNNYNNNQGFRTGRPVRRKSPDASSMAGAMPPTLQQRAMPSKITIPISAFWTAQTRCLKRGH